MKKRAFITGITGMDGSHLADLLLEKDYEVYGLIRRSSSSSIWRISHILDKVRLYTGDLLDQSSLENALKSANPHEVYNLAAQSFVKTSFDAPVYTSDATGVGMVRLLEAIRSSCMKSVKVYQASSSEMFGDNPETVYGETSVFSPRSPYGVAKVFAHYMCKVYRESYKMFISCGINFNHESERRGEEFVTRKITKGIAGIKNGFQQKIILGNLQPRRDWSYAPEVMDSAWRMLQRETPGVFVIASGIDHSVFDFLVEAFRVAGFKDEEYLNHVDVDKENYRPSEIFVLKGSSFLACQLLGWKPKVGFEEIVKRMVENDLALCDRSVQVT